jgi:hypothetical protein
MSTEIFYCGPVAVHLSAQNNTLRTKVIESLNLFTITWPPPHLSVSIDIRESQQPAQPLHGTYLKTARMSVEPTPDGLHAVSVSGTDCFFSRANQHWSIHVPSDLNRAPVPEDVEDLIMLVLTQGWRQAGWVPLHAGSIIKGSICALLCAPSGFGKTTLTAAMIRRGWQTLGDDKILLRLQPDGSALLAAMQHNFNLDPKTSEWFPEVGDLTRLPRYSVWTEKRKVHIADIWPGSELLHACPTHLIQLERLEQPHTLEITELTAAEVLSIFLRQTVIPKDRAFAQLILSAIATTAKRLIGLRVKVGAEAYHDPDCLAPLEKILAFRSGLRPDDQSQRSQTADAPKNL